MTLFMALFEDRCIENLYLEHPSHTHDGWNIKSLD